jgi:DNA topoisomerase-3
LSNTLVIAEKPSMGHDIANALAGMLGHAVVNDGLCQHVGPYTVVGARGHLFALCEPEVYGEQFKGYWRIAPLPALPEKFLIEPNFKRKNGRIVEDSNTADIRARIKRIGPLIGRADRVIHAGDPDREGQIIIDDILRYFEFTGPVDRLWLQAQTRSGIEDALNSMKNNTEYANLGISALARRESDWAVGLNATRAFTVCWKSKGHEGVLNVGRVLTPVVGMIVQREKDIENFKPIEHFTLRATITIDGQEPFEALWVKPEGEGLPQFDPSGKLITDRSFVHAIGSACHGAPATIAVADKTKKHQAPPLLFSLIELQKAAAKMGHSPDAVLAAAQSLYSAHKLTSYPRTDCQYAPESEHAKAAQVMKVIGANLAGVMSIAPGWDANRKSGAWNDKKLVEHYAIIPLATSCSVSSLTACERDVYRLICRQYAAQFFPDYEYMASRLVAKVGSEHFKATGKAPLIEGWRVMYGGSASIQKKAPDSDEQENLPNVSVGDTGIAKPLKIESSQTAPPKRFTAITMLEAMEKAHQFVTDPKVKAKLKQVEGIGTAATRAAIISGAIAKGFVSEYMEGKVIAYMPTPKAISYIKCMPEQLARPDLTAWFEGKIEELAKGTLEYGAYRVMLARLVDFVLSTTKNGEATKKMPTPQEMPEPPKTLKRGRAKPSVRTSRSPAAKPRAKKSVSTGAYF